MKNAWFVMLGLSFLMAGCTLGSSANAVPTPDKYMIYTLAVQTVQAQMTLNVTATPEPTITFTPPPAEPTLPPTETPEPTLEPTASWSYHSPGSVIAPILLYTHIADNKDDNPYYQRESNLNIPLKMFQEHMDYLQKAGYTTIPVSLLVQAIWQGAELPPKPVVVTFDGGTIGIYSKAFPVMKAKGFSGTIYLVAQHLDGKGAINTAQAKDLVENGWEIGCRGMTGAINLAENHNALSDEAGVSKQVLKDKIGVEVMTFAYPFGAMDAFAADKVARYGYRSAVGLGKSYQHQMNTTFYLSRIEINNTMKMEDFLALLPPQ